MQKQPKVLIAAPLSQKKEYCAFDWIDNVRRTEYVNFDIFLVDNSPNTTFVRRLWDYGVEADHIHPIGRPERYVADSQEIIRKRVLDRGYDYLYSVEIDNFPQPHHLMKLMSHRELNISLPYFLWQKEKRGLSIQTVSHTFSNGHVKWLPMNSPDSMLNFDGKKKAYPAPSLGCTLIHRKVLERVEFRVSNDPMDKGKFSDSFFHMDCYNLGINNYSLMTDIVEHRRFTWKHNLY